MRAWVVLLMLVLAGCSSQDDGATDETGDDGETDDGGTTGTPIGTTSGTSNTGSGGSGGSGGPSSNVTNSPPQLTATVRPGEPDFGVVFTINATDADGDALNWTLDADGDNATDASGAEVPAEVSFEYPAAGTYQATIRVSDGQNETSLTLEVVVEESGPEPFVGSGTARSPCPQCREVGANTGVGYRAGQSGVDSVFLAIPPEYIGRPFTATASTGDIDLAFRDGCSGGGTGGGLVGEAYAGDGDPAGTVPEGTVCVLMWNYTGANSVLTITIT